MKISKDTSLKWGKETELQSEKVPFTAGLHLSSQRLQQTKIADKAMSSLLSVSKPIYSMTQDSPQADSGMFSTGSYLSINGGDSEKRGVLSHDQSSMEFYPLHASVDSDSPKVSLLHYKCTYFVLYWRVGA